MNLKYMHAFAAAWPGRAIVQEALAQIAWYHDARRSLNKGGKELGYGE